MLIKMCFIITFSRVSWETLGIQAIRNTIQQFSKLLSEQINDTMYAIDDYALLNLKM
jgi:hypothetical protein